MNSASTTRESRAVLGRVHVWECDPGEPLGGRVVCRLEPLERLEGDGRRLSGAFVAVRNSGWLNEPGAAGEPVVPTPLGDAVADADGNFDFSHGRGGPRVDKFTLRSTKYRRRYLEAARFGEVNAYYHLDRIAHHVDELLRLLGNRSLPRVIVRVNAHHAAVIRDGVRDGEPRGERWVPFEGGHYRLPSPRNSMTEFEPVSPDGEIHLGPGRRVLMVGGLAEGVATRYRHNVAHNAGIIYHEYGHHISRYLADFRANDRGSRDRQSNTKTALDEGYCDYWAASMLGVPHIWVWHRSHVADAEHPRSLTSKKTAADFDHARGADPHVNGTIWAAALWDLRTRLVEQGPEGARMTDLLVLQSMRELGQFGDTPGATRADVRRARASLQTGLSALLRADQVLHEGANRADILAIFARRAMVPDAPPIARGVMHARDRSRPAQRSTNGAVPELARDSPLLIGIRRHVGLEGIPETRDLLSGADLETLLARLGEPPASLVAVGDVMMGARSSDVIAEHGADHIFAAVAPLFRRAPNVLGNLEGPFAKRAAKLKRNHSYRVRPELAAPLARAGFNVMTLANNHLLDCGRPGVRETLETMSAAGIGVVGAGIDRAEAHRPVILRAGALSVGVLGYYWNQRTSATNRQPGSAMDPPEALREDIGALRAQVDRVVVTFHWGVPYERDPAEADRDKARLAIELGADVVIGHHPHVIQPLEVYRDRPIFYSVGNFAFGTGNSRAEGLLVAVRFEPDATHTDVYPLYVKNRDPRVDYQPKVMRGAAGKECLDRLATVSGPGGEMLVNEEFRATLHLPWTSRAVETPARSIGLQS